MSTMNRPKRILLLALAGCLSLALMQLVLPPDSLPQLLSSGNDSLCESLRSLGDLAEWVARQNESSVCRDMPEPLYRRLPADAGEGGRGHYPLCRLSPPPPWLERRLRAGSVLTWVTDTGDGQKVPVFGYSGGDLITGHLVARHTWEGPLVRPLLARLRKLGPGNVTLLDVGSNIGVYTLQAAALGFPVVAVDANARNLARIGLALGEPALAAAGAEARVDLVWNLIAGPDSEPARLNYPADCNLGGATKFLRAVTDPVAAMPIDGDALLGLVRTRAVLMKLDAEGAEADFLRTGRRLFRERTVAAVQMEWLPKHHVGADGQDIAKFFDCRDYTLHSVDGKAELDIGRPDTWPTDILWLHKDFRRLLL